MGILNFDAIAVNPTYLTPQIVGGLIMGVGFIIGGFCPGTSVVAFSTLKLDGLAFLIGVVLGIGAFGESVSLFDEFYNSAFMDRFLLSDWMGVSIGIAVVLVILLAVAMFYGAEILERVFGDKIPLKRIQFLPQNRWKLLGSAALLGTALLILVIGQPTPERKWVQMSAVEGKRLLDRDVQIHPAELLNTMNDGTLYTRILDVRTESDFNLFHIEGARSVALADLVDSQYVETLKRVPKNTVLVLVSNGEQLATEAWKLLRAQGVLNLYLLEGGINGWLDTFSHSLMLDSALVRGNGSNEDEKLHFAFTKALGGSHPVSNPMLRIHGFESAAKYQPKIKLQTKKFIAGGCG